MAFQGKYDGKIVWPDEVSKDDKILCLECGDQLHIVKDFSRYDGTHVARHFRHAPGTRVGGHCHGGESNTHKMMKYVTTRKLTHLFPSCEINREKQVPGTDRIADVILEFDATVEKLGKGLIAECQHKNDEKDIEQVTREYTQAGFSVYWLNSSHFSNDFRTLSLPQAAKVWPNCVPIPYHWGGVDRHWEELGDSKGRVELEVVFPKEMLDEQEPELRKRWEMGSGDWNKENWLRFTYEVTPGESCTVCNKHARFMFWRDGLHASFRCMDHLPGEATIDDVLSNKFSGTIDTSEWESAR